MTLEQFVQNRLESIESIKVYVDKNIFPFESNTNTPNCFIRWFIINESEVVKNLSGNCSLRTANIQISIFTNTINVARKIAEDVIKSFSFDKPIQNIRCSSSVEINPIHEDKHTIHYPLRVQIIYNKE
jgi:hypothetical protein